MLRRLVAYTLTLFVSVILSCSGESRRESAARERGIADANDFIVLASQKKISQMKLQGFLLGVLDKANRLKQAGEDKAADIYIDSFENRLHDSVPDLFEQISSKN